MKKIPAIQQALGALFLVVTAVTPSDVMGQPALGNVASMDQNHIISTTFRQPFTTLPSNPTTAQAMREIDYYDGLGRPIQHIGVKASGGVAYKDLVVPISYDGLGRNVSEYLPYASAIGTGGTLKTNAITQQATYYTSTPPLGQSANTHPYKIQKLEASPLDRLIQQGFEGPVWQPAATRSTSSGRTVVSDRQVNNTIAYSNTAATLQASRYQVVLSSMNAPTLTLNGVYPDGELNVYIQYDENWNGADQRLHATHDYRDKQDRTVLIRTFRENPATSALELISTYYVYNQLGQLSFVLTPETSPDRTGVSTPTSTQMNAYAYTYRYDNRGRVVEKKIPAKGIQYFVYNKLDHLVLAQDALQRAKTTPEWTYYKYDVHGRQVISGRYLSSSSREALQSTVNASTVLWEDRNPSNSSGYNNTTFPAGNGAEVYLYTYYDQYDVPGLPAQYLTSGYSTMTQGLTTVSRTKVLNTTDQYLWSVSYYDDLGNIIRQYKQHYLGGGTAQINNYDEFSHTYTLTGLLSTTTRKHFTGYAFPSLEFTELTEFEYDHRERLLDTWHTINPGSGTRTLLSRLVYNEVGQVREKKIGSQNGGTSFAQGITYSYNARAWLGSAVSSHGLFSQTLLYNAGSNPQYNGNISSQQFSRKNSSGTLVSDTYSYTYDATNQLIKGEMGSAKGKEELHYDRMGNLVGLQRSGTSGTLVDNLSYTYTGGRLVAVQDAVTTSHPNYQLPGTTTYSYDANGNMSSRVNTLHTQANLTAISYNHLNLPQSYTTPSNTISYTYDANGNKLSSNNAIAPTQTREYISGVEYDSGVLELIHIPEGRVVKNGIDYQYHYFITDYLGNNRVGLTQATNVTIPEFSADYYPFGLRYPAIQIDEFSTKNLYLYNAKELQGELGGQYDYGARFYDPVIGRWNVIDPLSEQMRRWSPYAYGFNNPIQFIDPDGRQPRRSDPPGWFKSAYNAWIRLATGTSGSSANNAVPNASPQTQSINRALGMASDVKDISAAAVPYALSTSAYVGEGLQTAGTATMAAGYVLAPVTEGASLALVPAGAAIELVGTGLQVPEMIASGDHGRIAYAAGSSLLFGGMGTVIKRTESVGTITKTDAGILNFINDIWNKTADFIFNHTTKLKEGEDKNKDQNR